ncbi:glutamate ABC transporter substrate-binding protein [Streptomyces sp. NPDC000594]|uniref:glutamate ABC transporter substrate-binding protein n=1 Tax=Streptomyces sp. NPDC000594 TaxID=3154261 RepID=UPI00333295AC
MTDRAIEAGGTGGSREGHRSGRRGLRGWGGVAGMAAACALTIAATLLPLSWGAAGAPAPDSRTGGPPPVTLTAAEKCTEPERSLRPSPEDGPTIRAIRKRGYLIVGVDQNSYRWGYRDPISGDIKGFDIDLARTIAEDLLGSRKAVVFRAVSTNQRVSALDSERVDIVVRTMTINCKRIKQVAFSTAYFRTGQQILAPEESDITGWNSSLRGKRLCTAEGSTATDALAEETQGAVHRDRNDGNPADEDLLTVPNQLDCLVRIQEGLADAVLTDSALAAGQAAQDPAMELKGVPFKFQYYGVATKLGKEDLVRRINKVLEEYRSDGSWIKAYRHWLAKDLPGITRPPDPKYHERER